jgi:redox-sensitive bicupin YhaK (pirin superfamily)
MVFRPGDAITVTATRPSRLMLLGGDTLAGPRFIWWNFVASSRDRIEAAKEAWAAGDWQHGRFRLPPSDDGEHIPLPER